MTQQIELLIQKLEQRKSALEFNVRNCSEMGLHGAANSAQSVADGISEAIQACRAEIGERSTRWCDECESNHIIPLTAKEHADLQCKEPWVNQKYPLFPSLPEGGEEVAQQLMDGFRDQMKNVAENVLAELYVGVCCHVESDHWMNYRNKMKDGLVYDRQSIGKYDWQKLRDRIWTENHDAIVAEYRDDQIEKLERSRAAMERACEAIGDRLNKKTDELKEMTEKHSLAFFAASRADRLQIKLNCALNAMVNSKDSTMGMTAQDIQKMLPEAKN